MKALPSFRSRFAPRWLAGILLLAGAGCSGDAPLAELPDDPNAEAASEFLVIAHRGYSGRAPEHSFAAWDRAVAAGAAYLEQDLQMTADSVLVVLHDATLDRTARGPAGLCTGPVAARTFAELDGCEVGSWFNTEYPDFADPGFEQARIPTLSEVLERYAESQRLYIETKDPESAPGMEQALVAELRRYPHLFETADPPRVLIQSFSGESLRRMREIEPRLPLVMLFGRISSQEIQDSLASLDGLVAGIGPHYSSVDADLVQAAHARGIVVHPYTVNTAEEMDRLKEIGVDGIFTNEVEMGLAVAGEE